MNKKVDFEEAKELLNIFNNKIVPYMCEHNMSLHEAFETLRPTDNDLYKPLSELWSTTFGKAYIRSFIQKYGNKLYVKVLETINKEAKQNERNIN